MGNFIKRQTDVYQFQFLSTSPSDSTDYYCGSIVAALGVSAGGAQGRRVRFLKNGFITSVSFELSQSTNGSGETVNIYLYNVDTTISTLIGTFTSNFGVSTITNFIFNDLFIMINNTDKYSIRIQAPAFVTNPANWIGSFNVQIIS
jgi:hypothetical protein